MSAATGFISGPSSAAHTRKSQKGASLQQYKSLLMGRGTLKGANPKSLFVSISRKSSSVIGPKRNPKSRPFSPVMEWQEGRAEIEIDVPASVAYSLYSDRERIPEWMPFISSVENLKDKPGQSRWSLKYDVLGQNVEFSWLARNLQPIPNQKIHWRSLDGLPNKGAVRFYPKGPSSCRVELTISYEVPQILSPVASALKPFSEAMLTRGLERFAEVARNYHK